MKYLSSLKTKNLSGEICLLRADFNIEDEDLKSKKVHPRVAAVLPAIKFLISKSAKVVILSHRGRPDPKSYKLQAKSYSLRPFAKILSDLLKKPVGFVEFNKIDELNKDSFAKSSNNVFLLENLRFFLGEEKNDKKFAKQLAQLGDFYVNEAFSVSHREDASVAAITEFLPSYAGYSLENEIRNLSRAMNPKKPLVVIFGGIKISDKIGLIDNFWNKADKFLLGGGIANTFFAAQKMPMGKSIYEKEKIAFVRKMMKSPKIVLPVDSAIENGKILDIGPETAKKYAEIIGKAKTIIWNGPMGQIEEKKFRRGSEAILKAIVKSKAFAVIGGGETTSLLQQTRINADIDADRRGYIGVNQRTNRRKSAIFMSTGGGAMLEFLAGKKLPGIEALNKK